MTYSRVLSIRKRDAIQAILIVLVENVCTLLLSVLMCANVYGSAWTTCMYNVTVMSRVNV